MNPKPFIISCDDIDLFVANQPPSDLSNLCFFFIKDGCKKKFFGKGLKPEQAIQIQMNNQQSIVEIVFAKFGSEGGDVQFKGNQLTDLFQLLKKTPFFTWNQLDLIKSERESLKYRYNKGIDDRITEDNFENVYYLRILQDMLDFRHNNKISLLLHDAFIQIMLTTIFRNSFKYSVTYNITKNIPDNLWEPNMVFIDFIFKLYNTITLLTYKKLGIQLKIRLDQLLPIKQQGELSFILSISNYKIQVKALIDFILKYTKPNIMQISQPLPMSQPLQVTGGKKKKLSDKTVHELRTLMKKHKKKCSKDGKRLTKSQMITILKRCL